MSLPRQACTSCAEQPQAGICTVCDHQQRRKDINRVSTRQHSSGIRRNLFSSGATQAKSIRAIISEIPQMEVGNMQFPLRQDGQLFKIDLNMPQGSSTQDQVAFNKSTTTRTPGTPPRTCEQEKHEDAMRQAGHGDFVSRSSFPLRGL